MGAVLSQGQADAYWLTEKGQSFRPRPLVQAGSDQLRRLSPRKLGRPFVFALALDLYQ